MVCYRFYFLKFLLICQLESLDLTLTWNGFAFWKYFRILSQNSSGNKVFRMFLSQTAKTFFTNYSLIFLLMSLRFLSKIFCWLFSPKRLLLAMRNLGRIARLFLECFVLQVTKSLFLENGWICGENHEMVYWVFVAGN